VAAGTRRRFGRRPFGGSGEALVKAESRPGYGCATSRSRDRARRGADQGVPHRLCGTTCTSRPGTRGAAHRRVPMVTGTSSAASGRDRAGVRDVAVGDLVSGEGHLVCGRCRNCRAAARTCASRPAAWACTCRARSPSTSRSRPATLWVHRRPGRLDVAAIFDPFGNAVHTACRSRCRRGRPDHRRWRPFGVMARGRTSLPPRQPARGGHDVSDYRLDLARKIGVTHALHARADHRRRAARPGRSGRLRRRPGDCPGQPRLLPRYAGSRHMNHAARSHARLPADEIAIDCEHW
jgi:threonine 3-dehydrogenase